MEGKHLLIIAAALSIFLFPKALMAELYIDGDNWFGCKDKKYFQDTESFINSGDREAANKALSYGLMTGICKEFKNGERVYLEDTAMWEGLFKLRSQGETQGYWTITKAYRVVVESDQNSQQQGASQAAPQGNFYNSSENRNGACKLDGVLEQSGRPVFFISRNGKVSPLKIGDTVCGGEVMQTYSPREADGITPGDKTDIQKYRVKVRFSDEEKIYMNGDIFHDHSSDIASQIPDSSVSNELRESGLPPSSPENPAIKDFDQPEETQNPADIKDVPGMNHVRDSEENFKSAQDAERQRLYGKAVFFYERAVQYAQWALPYIIEGKKDSMRMIVQKGRQKQKELAGKADAVFSQADSALLPKLKNAREIMKWVKANVRYASDAKVHGERDYWQAPEETILLRSGDCEDYAFLIQALLKKINIESFVLSVHGREISKNLGHAICVFPKDAVMPPLKQALFKLEQAALC